MTRQPDRADNHAPGPIDRACTLLELIAESGGELGFTEIATRSGLAPATTHRMLRTLTERGILRQLPSRRYELGSTLFRLGNAAGHRVHHRAQPVLSDVTEELGETSYLACLDGGHVRYLACVESPHPMRSCAQTGTRVPLHSTAIGKALLIQLSASDRNRMLSRTNLTARTEHTTTDVRTLRTELRAAAENHYTTAYEEDELGASDIAVAVAGSESVCALAVSGPHHRIGTFPAHRTAKVLHAAAERLGGIR